MNKPKNKIVIVLPTLNTGGAESVMVTIANQFCKLDEVHLIVGLKEGALFQKLHKDVIVHNLDSKRMSRSIPKLVRKFSEIRPVAIFSTMMYNNIVTTIAYRMSMVRAKLILREATTPSIVLDRKSTIFNIVAKWSYKQADAVVAVSGGVLNDLKSVFNISNVRRIPNPIISDELVKYSQEECNHKFFTIGVPVIVTVGKVIPAKDYITLVKAFYEVQKTKDARLIIVGPRMEGSEYAEKLDRLISEYRLSDKVDLVGFDSNPFKYMAYADVFVLSSKREGLPGVLIQALYINGNVVSTDCRSGPREILDNGKYGSLVNIEDSRVLADAIINHIEKPRNKPATMNHLEKYKVDSAVETYYLLIR